MRARRANTCNIRRLFMCVPITRSRLGHDDQPPACPLYVMCTPCSTNVRRWQMGSGRGTALRNAEFCVLHLSSRARSYASSRMRSCCQRRMPAALRGRARRSRYKQQERLARRERQCFPARPVPREDRLHRVTSAYCWDGEGGVTD